MKGPDGGNEWDFSAELVPQRKWIDVSAALHNSMKSYRAKWYRDFANHILPLGAGLRVRDLEPEMENMISVLQFAAAATTVRENGYIKLRDWDFFIDLICLSITTKR